MTGRIRLNPTARTPVASGAQPSSSPRSSVRSGRWRDVDAELVALFIEHELTEEAWEALGAAAGYDPPRAPSLRTRALVLELVRVRAARGAA